MNLSQLIDGMGLTPVRGSPHMALVELSDDSRDIQEGWLFIARTAGEAGRSYIADALARGAAAIVAKDEPLADLSPHVVWVRGERIDQALVGRLAERFFNHPARHLRIVGITGTNGKTTTAYLVQHLLNHAGVKCGLLGTVTLDEGDGPKPASLTTPGAIALSRSLSRMVANGCRAAAIEVSSHALDQGRTAAIDFAVGVFTNLTGDHLDYHGTMDAYADAKARLFAQLGPHAWAVVNMDDAYGPRMAAAFTGEASHVLGCSVEAGAEGEMSNVECRMSDVQPIFDQHIRDSKSEIRHPPLGPSAPWPLGPCLARILRLTAQGSDVRFTGPWGEMELTLPLVGRHNVYNALQAAAAAHAVTDLGRTLRAALTSCPPVPGRLEPVRVARVPGADPDLRLGSDQAYELPGVLVDYAHTHDALENVLTALRPVTQGRLIVLFGCGGDRDRTKRPKMAAVACRLADEVWITSDNPRTEQPEAIINEILAGVPEGVRIVKLAACGLAEPERNDPGKAAFVEVDRAAAIRQCIAAAEVGDTVLLAGKGHEDYQIVGTTKRHFDDREHAAKALEVQSAKFKVQG